MKIGPTLPLLLALVLFLAFFANVLAGSQGWGEVLGDVTQVVLLLASCIAFVVGILMKEAEEKAKSG